MSLLPWLMPANNVDTCQSSHTMELHSVEAVESNAHTESNIIPEEAHQQKKFKFPRKFGTQQQAFCSSWVQ